MPLQAEAKTESFYVQHVAAHRGYQKLTVTNLAGGVIVFTKGFVMGQVTDGGGDDGKACRYDPAGIDGSELPIGVYVSDDLSLAASADSPTPRRIATNAGILLEANLDFNGATAAQQATAVRALSVRGLNSAVSADI